MGARTSWLLIALIVVMTLFRLIGIDYSPPGFHIDEASNATHIVCLSQTRADANGTFLPLFSDQFEKSFQIEKKAGMIPPTHLYFGALWVSIFGHSIASIRAISAFLMIMTTAGAYLLVRHFCGRPAAMFCALSASLSPWAFQVGRISLMVAFEPLCLVFWIYFTIRSKRILDAFLAGIFLSLTLYSYPPALVQVPILTVPLLWLKKRHHGLDRRFLIVCFSAAILTSLPLIHHIGTAEGQLRVEYVSIFGKPFLDHSGGGHAPVVILKAFLSNFFAHFSPHYLFFRGDANLIHSTQRVGQLSWLDTFAFCAAIVLLMAALFRRTAVCDGRNETAEDLRPLLLFSIIGVLSGIVPASLTWQGIPHSLRSVGTLPFLFVLTGLTLYKLSEVWNPTPLVVVGISTLFAVYFLSYYFTVYPSLSKESWMGRTRDAAEQARNTGDWPRFSYLTLLHSEVATRYYLIEYGGEDCLSSKQRLKKLRRHRI
jgi:4-amino-4-deoxy-L-arabinose transferase-like glycosyltransferase